MTDRDIIFKDLSKKRLDEIIILCEFLAKDNSDYKSKNLLDRVQIIVFNYLDLLEDDKKSKNGENEKGADEQVIYWGKINYQLSKLKSFPTREKELQTIANFLQNKLSSDELPPLQEILEKYHQEIQRLQAD